MHIFASQVRTLTHLNIASPFEPLSYFRFAPVSELTTATKRFHIILFEFNAVANLKGDKENFQQFLSVFLYT